MKNPARLKISMLKTIAVVLLMSVLSLSAIDSASANITSAPKLDVMSSGTTIGSQYSFVPQVTSATQLQTFGSNLWRNTRWSDTDSRVFRSIELTNPTNRDGLKGSIGAKYTNVGFYNGQSVDLKITLTNWSRYGNPGKVGNSARVGNISFESKNIGMSTQGYNFVDTTWEYVKSGTNTRIAVSGYFTYSDIDIYQGLQFSPTTSSNIHRYMITDTSNRLKYLRSNNQDRFYDTDDNDINDTTYNHRYAFTFLYGNLSSFSLRWMTDWSKSIRGGRLVDKNRYYYGNTTSYAAGEYLFFIINKPARTVTPAPTKTVSRTTGLDTGDTLRYGVHHQIPQEDPKYYYTKYVMSDTLDPVMEDVTATVFNAAGSNMTAWFDKVITGNKVVLTAKSTTLDNKNFYGDRYYVKIEGKVNRTKLDAAAGTADTYVIKNKASVVTNTGTLWTNEVKTTVTVDAPTVPPVTPPPADAMDTIQIFTNNKVSTGLRTIVDVGAYASGLNADDYDESTALFEVFDRSNNRKVHTATFNIENLPRNHEFRMATDYLAKGAKTNYEFKLTLPKKKTQYYTRYFWVYYWFNHDNDPLTPDTRERYQDSETLPVLPIPTKTPISIDSYGFTSSEKNFTYADLSGEGELDYTGVIKTTKGRTTVVAELEEQTIITFPKLDPLKTGYGFGPKVLSTYRNDLRNLETIKSEFSIDKRMIDSYLEYPTKDGLIAIPLENTEPQYAGYTRSMELELPTTYVERNTGYLFKSSSDSRIRNGIAGNARKLYVPIWADIAPTYEYRYATVAPIGVHDITFDIRNPGNYSLDLTAYMYNHKDSGTEELDELLVHPIAQNDVPDDWELGTPD